MNEFQVFIEFCKILFLFYVLVFWPQGMWDLSFPTRNWTHTPCFGRWSCNRWTTREVPGCHILERHATLLPAKEIKCPTECFGDFFVPSQRWTHEKILVFIYQFTWSLPANPGLAKYSPWDKSNPLLVFVKFYWNTNMLIHLGITSGCFCVTMTELIPCNRDHMSHKA